jgi:tetratricopeptide (TPR) repeat protein
MPAMEAERLFLESEGLPFFLIEYLAVISGQAADISSSESRSVAELSAPNLLLPMPEGVRDLLHSRLLTVDEMARQLLQTAAVIGRSFSIDILLEASGRGEEETVTALDSLLAQGLLFEHRPAELTPASPSPPFGTFEAPVYDFNHQKLRTLVYGELSLARRRLLHKRVAHVLANDRQRSTPGNLAAAQTAYHFQRAGMEEEAASYFYKAGEQARKLFANAEALAHFQSALALGYSDQSALHEKIADLFTLQGSYDQAIINYESAAAIVEPKEDSRQMSRLEMKLGRVYHRRGEWTLAAGHFEQGFESMMDDGGRARLLTDWSLTAYQMGDSKQALELAQRAIVLADAANDQMALAQAHNVLGVMANSRRDWQTANQELEQSLALANTLNDPDVKIAALNNLSIARRHTGQLDQARELVERALALCVEVGDRHREAALHNNLADLYHIIDSSDEAMIHLKRAVAIYAEIDGEVGQWQPEVWKLTEW